MKILITNGTYKPHYGGVENSLYYMAKSLIGQGHRVLLLASDQPLSGNFPLKREEVIDGIPVIRFRSVYPAFIQGAPIKQLLRIVTAFFMGLQVRHSYKPHIVISREVATGIGLALSMQKVAHFYIAPAVAATQDRYSSTSSLSSRKSYSLYSIYQNILIHYQKLYLQKIFIRIASKTLVFSESMSHQIRAIVPSKTSDIHLLRPGVDTNVFTYSMDKKNAKLKLELRDDQFTLVILARLIGVKRVDLAIDAIAQLKDEAIQLMIVGDGPEKQALLDLVNKRNIASKVLFYPRTNNPEKYYQAADAFLMTSTYESFGQTILEAMSCGLPVIGFVSDGTEVITATTEILFGTKHNYLVKLSDKLLADKIVECMSMTNTERDLVQQEIRQFVKANYSWSKMCSIITKLSTNYYSGADPF